MVLKRLPCWGEKVRADQVNFEWPTQEMLDRMQPDVHLQTLEFKGDYALSSARCILSSGESSPVFENADYEHECLDVVNLDPNRRARVVMAHDMEGEGSYAVCLKLLDGFGCPVGEFNPGGYDCECTRYEIKENEELIGIYGVKDKI